MSARRPGRVRPVWPGTYCHDAPLTNVGTPKRFASISYPLETRWPVCRTIGNPWSGIPAPDLGGDCVEKQHVIVT